MPLPPQGAPSRVEMQGEFTSTRSVPAPAGEESHSAGGGNGMASSAKSAKVAGATAMAGISGTTAALGMSEAMPTPTGSMPPTTSPVETTTPHSGEVRLMEMLGSMDYHMQQLRETQQGVVATVELACRNALGTNFGRLVLVGSAALRVETPGSDVDVVCFTRQDITKGVYLPADVLRWVHWSLHDLINQYADSGASFHMELIDDARVPILRVIWGVHMASPVTVDVSVDQNRPVNHIHWFQRVGAAPRPQAPPPAVAPLVTLTLRCVKWWIRQRQIPRTKEGGLPTVAWLLMAVHVCSLPETHALAINSSQRPMAALLASLTAFFNQFASTPNGLDGTLIFTPVANGSSSDFKRHPGRHGQPWAELSVVDPSQEGERFDLAPRLHPATQLLIAHELRRARHLLEALPRATESFYGQSAQLLDQLFEALPDGTNELPSYIASAGLGALVVCGEIRRGIQPVEFAILENVIPRVGWQAPFLHRGDERSELHARLYDVDETTGRCTQRKRGLLVLAPCHFVCRVGLEKDASGSFKVDREGLLRFVAMRHYLRDLGSMKQQQVDATVANVATPSRC